MPGRKEEQGGGERRATFSVSLSPLRLGLYDFWKRR